MQIQILYDFGRVQFAQNQTNLLQHIRWQSPGIIAFKEPFQSSMFKAADHLFSVWCKVTPVKV